MMIRDGAAKYNNFSDNFKITSGVKNSPEYLFGLKKNKNDIKIALKPTCIKL